MATPQGVGAPNRLAPYEPREAGVVRQIFKDYVSGKGFARLARELNEEGVPSPRSRASRSAGWCPRAIRSVLVNPIYRGE